MSNKRRDEDFLSDIKEAMENIVTYTKGLNFDEFVKDRKTQDAVIRNLEVVGEATKNVSGDLKNKYQKIPWKKMAGLRDKIIHHYFGIKYDIIWQVNGELFQFIPQIKEIIENEFKIK